MVTNFAKWALTYANIDPKLVADVYGIPEEECWNYIAKFNMALNEAQVERNKTKEQRVNDLKAFLEEIPNKDEIRRAILKERLLDAKKNPHKHDVKKLLTEVKLYMGDDSMLSEAQVSKAKEFPLANLIESKHGMAHCPFHEDKTASLNIKNNYYYCHGCGANGDVIKFVMDRDGLTFVQAVKQLQ